MTAPVLPPDRAHVAGIVALVVAETLTPALALDAIAGDGYTPDETALDAAVHHLGIVQGLRDRSVDARTVVDALPTLHYDEVHAAALLEQEAHLTDALGVLAVRAVYCAHCFAPVTDPVRDPQADLWLRDKAPVWCSRDCVDAYAEAVAS